MPFDIPKKANKPSATYVSVSAGTNFSPTSFWWNVSENVDHYDLKIWNGTYWDGDAYKIEWDIRDTSCSLQLPAGYYEAYVDSVNSEGCTMSENVVRFTVGDEKIDIGTDFYATIEHQSTGLYLTNQQNNIAGEVKDGTKRQIWKFERLSNGAYKIKSILDNTYIDVFDGRDEDDTNIQTFNGHDGVNQQFYIYYAYDACYFRPVYSNTRMLDMSLSDHNVALWIGGKDWEPQEFNINKISYCNYVSDYEPIDLGQDFFANIEHQSTGLYLTNEKNNIIGKSKDNSTKQAWQFTRLSNGAYKIKSLLNDTYMDVYGSGDENDTNIQTFNGHNGLNQQFYVYRAYDAYYLRPVCSYNKMLDMSLSSHNVALWDAGYNWEPQEFNIIIYDKKPQWAKVSISQKLFYVGENVTFNLSSDLGVCYTIGIDDEDDSGRRIDTYDTHDISYTRTFDKAGKYSCYITTYNTYGLADSERIYFEVYDKKPQWAKVSIPKNLFDVGEDVTFNLSSDTGLNYTVGIDDEDDGGKRIDTFDTWNSSYTRKFDKAGNYSCYITTYNQYGLADSERIYFKVYDCSVEHDYKLTSEKAATCTTDGEKIYTCSRCSDTKTETVKATGHSYTTKVVDPTCTAKSYTLHTCKNCNESYKDTYTNALGHDYKLTSEKAATCTTDGEKIYTCSRCGDTKTETVKATGHSYTTKVIAPTCTEKGYTLHTCSKCGDSYKDTYTNAAGHKYEETIVAPTTTEQGYTLHTCSVCKHSYKDNYTNILLSNNSTLSADTIKLGETIIANAKATGGTGEYLYQVVYKQTTQSKWTTAQSYKANATVTFKPADELKNVSTISAQTINLGSTVTVNAKATGSTGFYTYAVYYKQKAQTKWTTKQDFKSNNTIAVKPAKATTYDICVKVKDDKGTIVKKYFTVNVTDFKNTSTLSATEIKLGNTVKVSCSATGSTGYYQYAVYYKKTSDTKWTTKQSYSSNNTVTIKPAKATTYDVCVKVKDNQNNEVKKYFTVTVK